MSEAALQRYLFKQAKLHSVYHRKTMAVGRVGFPDCLLASDVKAVYVELKSPSGDGRLSVMQEREIKRMKGAGLDVRVIDTREQVDAIIRELVDDDTASSD